MALSCVLEPGQAVEARETRETKTVSLEKMKDLQKKFVTVAPAPYSIPSPHQMITDNLQLPLQHLNQVQIPTNYLLGGVPIQNSSGWLASFQFDI